MKTSSLLRILPIIATPVMAAGPVIPITEPGRMQDVMTQYSGLCGGERFEIVIRRGAVRHGAGVKALRVNGQAVPEPALSELNKSLGDRALVYEGVFNECRAQPDRAAAHAAIGFTEGPADKLSYATFLLDSTLRPRDLKIERYTHP